VRYAAFWFACGLAMAQPPLRLKVPAASNPPARSAARTAAGGHLIVQFADAPPPEALEELARRGARVLQYIPDHAVLVAADRELDLEGLDIVLAGPLEARRKISPQAAPSGVNVVEFHPDVALNEARGLVLRAGLELRENPDLGPHRLLVRGAGLAQLAEHDEVAYIFPASEALAAGRPTERCFAEVAQIVTTYGSGWDGAGLGSAALTYTFGADTTRLTPSAARAEVVRAMQKWAEVAAVTWQAGSNSSASRNVHVLWATGSHGDSTAFDGPYGVLAHTYFPAPPNPEPIAGDMHFDDAESWRIGAHMDVFSVALHELGHALGLGHSDDPGAVMYPYYSLVSDLTAEDRNAILTLYAPAAPPPPPPPPPPAVPPQPAAVSATPGSGTGSGATFSFVFSDAGGAQNLTGMAMLFSTSSSALAGACYIVYEPAAQSVALLWDGANGANRKPLGSSAALANSYCSIGTVSASVSGNNVTLTVPVTFLTAFNGAKNIYMEAVSGVVKSGWAQRGSYTVSVAGGGAPVAQGMTPNLGSGFDQRFQFTVRDAAGSQYITGVAVLFAASLNPVGGCMLVYDRPRGTVSLAYDNANGQSPVVPGTSATVANSQCALKGAGTSVAIGATTVVLTVDLSFRAGFAGTKNVYLYGAEANANTGWMAAGQWTVPGSTATPVGMTPNSGSGAWPSFTFTVSDNVSAANLAGAAILFTTGAATNQANACYVVYDRTAGTVGLFDDAGTGFAPKPVGSSLPLQNTQCAVGYAAAHASGNSLNVTVYFYLKPAFAGARTVYLRALQALGGSAWAAVGTWSVP
jgi:hypothetical protein